MKKTIILLNGLPRVGKDTSADFMLDKGYKKTSFAGALKGIIARTFDISLETLDEYKNLTDEYQIRLGSTPITDFRKLLQRFGTEGMKPVFGDSVWADITYKNIMSSTDDKVVVADFRFLVEYQPSDEYNLITVLIKDDRELPTEGHKSDVELYQNNFNFDYTIQNTGTLEELELKIKDLLNKI